MKISKGIFLMLLATVMISVMQAMVKTIPDIPVVQIIFFRAVFSLPICYLILKKDNASLQGKNTFMLITRGLIGTASLLTFFYTIQNIPLATAVTIGHLSPLILAFLGRFILKDKLNNVQWISLVISFLGIFLIKGFDSRITGVEILIAIVSAIFAALAHFSVSLLKDENPNLILFYFSAVVIPFLAPFVIYNWVQPDLKEWIILFIIGILSHIGQYALTNALRLEKISKLVGFYYLGILIAIAIGYFFFEEGFNFMTLAGMILILLSLLLPVFHRIKPELP